MDFCVNCFIHHYSIDSQWLFFVSEISLLAPWQKEIVICSLCLSLSSMYCIHNNQNTIGFNCLCTCKHILYFRYSTKHFVILYILWQTVAWLCNTRYNCGVRLNYHADVFVFLSIQSFNNQFLDPGTVPHLDPKHENVLDILVSAEYLTNVKKIINLIDWSFNLNIFFFNYRVTSRSKIWMTPDFLKKSCAQFWKSSKLRNPEHLG